MRAQLTLHLKDWMRLPLDEISKAMTVRRHHDMAGSPSAANHVLRSFRAIYNHARRTGDLPECPTMAIEWFEDKPDGRIIENLKHWRKTIDDLPNPIHRVFYELLLFTGLRKTEVFTLKWEQVLEDRIHLPMTKNGRSFDLPISQLHHEILAPLRPLSSDWVFPSPKSETGHITRPVRLKYNPHMHRRTFATVAMEAGVLEEIVGRLLNHTPLSITGQRYVRPSLDALRPSMEIACDELLKRIDS
jgi:integrase